MWAISKQLLKIFELGLFILAIFLSIANINERYNTNKTTTKTYQASLSEIEFPLKLSILINPGFAQEDLAIFGYEEPNDYFAGRGQSGPKSYGYGWVGHSEYGGVIGSVSGIKQQRIIVLSLSFPGIFKNLSKLEVPDILKNIWFTTGKSRSVEFVTIPKTATFLPYFPGIRAELDLNISYGTEKIGLIFQKRSNYAIDIQLDDKFLNTWRPLIRHVKTLMGRG